MSKYCFFRNFWLLGFVRLHLGNFWTAVDLLWSLVSNSILLGINSFHRQDSRIHRTDVPMAGRLCICIVYPHNDDASISSWSSIIGREGCGGHALTMPRKALMVGLSIWAILSSRAETFLVSEVGAMKNEPRLAVPSWNNSGDINN